MSSRLLIRSFQPGDAEQCSFLMQDFILNHANNLFYETRQNFAQARTPKYIRKASKDRLIIVAEINGKIIGMGALKEHEIRHMYILAEYQQKDVGSTILHFLENEAKNRGINAIIVNSVFHSEGFYSRNGYKMMKKVTLNLHGAFFEATYMRKRL